MFAIKLGKLGFAFIFVFFILGAMTAMSLMFKPSLSVGVKFRTLSSAIDRAWYEIRIGALIDRPIVAKIGYVPSVPYFIGIAMDSVTGVECEALAKDLSLRINVDLYERTGKRLAQESVGPWVASYPSLQYAKQAASQRKCTLYGKERNSVAFSRIAVRTIEISLTGSRAALPNDAVIVLDGFD